MSSVCSFPEVSTSAAISVECWGSRSMGRCQTLFPGRCFFLSFIFALNKLSCNREAAQIPGHNFQTGAPNIGNLGFAFSKATDLHLAK